MRTMCPYCHQEFEVKEEYLGQTVVCSDCNRSFIVQEVKSCPRCGTTNSHNAIVCAKCRLDLTVAHSLPRGYEETEPDDEVSTAERWKNIWKPLSKILSVLLKVAIVAAIAAGGYFGYRYYTDKKQEEAKKKLEQEKPQIKDELHDLEAELKKTQLGAGMDYEAVRIHRAVLARARSDHSRSQVINYSVLADTARRQRILEGYDIRLQNIGNFISRYDSIMAQEKLPVLTDKTKNDLRKLVLISRSDAYTILQLKHLFQNLKTAKEPDEIAEDMNRDFPVETKEKLLIVYLCSKDWKKISSDAAKIIADDRFPQQFLSEDEFGTINRLAETVFPAGRGNPGDATESGSLKKHLMTNYLKKKWRNELIKLKTEEYTAALQYYNLLRTTLESARIKVLTAVIQENGAHFSHLDFANLEKDYMNRDQLSSDEQKRRIEEDYARLFVFAQTSNCKIEVPYYDRNYFRRCHILSSELIRFGLKPEYPPTNWEEAFPKTDIKVATGDESQRKKFEEDLSSYIERNRNNDRVKKFTRELLAMEVLAEIERIDGIIKELNDKIHDPENAEIELLGGVFLYPEKEAEKARQKSDPANDGTFLNNIR